MVFNSVIFIFCFLPIFLLIYYFVPARARNPVLFAGSLFFYAWGDPTYLVLMLFSSFFNYYMGKELGKITDEDPSRKRNLIFAVVINLLILGFFKYWGFHQRCHRTEAYLSAACIAHRTFFLYL